MTVPHWMIYGANGYTGRLILAEALKRGHRPVLAGRSSEVDDLARAHGLTSARFELKDPTEIARRLNLTPLVLNCAGPFSATGRPFFDACLRSKTHYLDITGEAPFLESMLARSNEARAAGITAIPGMGFDVVATDCLAAKLRAKLKSKPKRLFIALKTIMKPSGGTARTALELFDTKLVRREGQLVEADDPYETFGLPIEHPRRLTPCMRVAWGDVATGFVTTEAPNIETFLATPRLVPAFLRAIPSSELRRWIARWALRTDGGPSEKQRSKSRVTIWAQLESVGGERVESRLRVIDGYDFTVHSTLLGIESMVRKPVATGVWTPSQAFGSEFVLSIPGTEELA